MRACVRLCALLALPVAAATAFAAQSGGLDQILGRVQTNAGQFLPPDRAFQLFAEPLSTDEIRLSWEIAPTYYLYRNKLKVATTSATVRLGALDLPQGQSKTDEYFGTQQVYHNDLVAILHVVRGSTTGPLTVPIKVTYQGCAPTLCYPPITKLLPISLPALGGYGGSADGAPATGSSAPAHGAALTAGGAPTGGAASAAVAADVGSAAAPYQSDQDRYASVVRNGSLAGIVAFFYLAGLVLAFTPCVLPMVPIVSGIIAGGADRGNLGSMRGFSLSFVYVIGMALTYTAAGIAVAAGGQHVQAAFEKWWVVATFAALFIALALSMFGVFTLQMPAAIQTRLAGLSGRQSAGSFGGVFVMGALSALIVTTCVAPALVGALVVIGQSGAILRGGLALFVMGLGMGTPLLVVGASAGKLLPRAGAWMETVKRLFGALMLAVAAWMLARIVPARFALLLWAVPAAAAAVVLWNGAAALRWGRVATRFAAALAGAYSLALLAGVLHGATDPLAPWSEARQEPAFLTIKSVADLDREVAAAHELGRPVMLDFYADWCVSCKEMEKYTFTDPSVQAALGRAVLLRADVTRNDADDQALLGHFGIYGPPTIAFYGPDGSERRSFRVVGYMKSRDFASVVRLAFASEAATAATAATTHPTGVAADSVGTASR